jgi:DNA-binding HxlR family transcriptional regulator
MNIKAQDRQKLSKAMRIISDYWTLQIIDLLRVNSMGFNELQRGLDNVSPTTLSTKLKDLALINVVEKIQGETLNYPVYQLTLKGRLSLPIIDEINKFIASYHQEQQ